jgi:hypothetical protein
MLNDMVSKMRRFWPWITLQRAAALNQTSFDYHLRCIVELERSMASG